MPELPPLDPTQTARERFIVHEQPGCAGCHIPIDHIGFTFEHYDSVGAYRESDAGQVIDDSGSLNIGSSEDGRVVGAVAMTEKLLATPELRACVTRQWHRFALGRMEAEADACTLAALGQKFEGSGSNLRELVLAIVTQDSFRFRPGTSE